MKANASNSIAYEVYKTKYSKIVAEYETQDSQINHSSYPDATAQPQKKFLNQRGGKI